MTDQKRKNTLIRTNTVFPSVILNETTLEEIPFIDYLGVRLDGGLRWNDYVDKLAKYISSNIIVKKNIPSLINLSQSNFFIIA
jgi:hypothetical protein